jgi:replicative DNA helicase
MSEITNELQTSIDSSPLLYEQQILQCAVANHLFFISHRSELCPYNHRARQYRADFNVNWHNVLYEAVAIYWSGFDTTIQEGPVPKAFIENYLNVASADGKILDKEIDEIGPLITSIYEAVQAGAIRALTDFIESGVLRYWLGKQLIKNYLNSMQSDLHSFTPERLASDVQRLMEQRGSDSSDIVTVDEAVNSSSDRGEQFLSMLPQLDIAIGGGFCKREHTLVASTTGGGKTVFACQLASYWASLGSKVVFVSTEQPPGQLLYRMYSDKCNVPFELFNKFKENPDQEFPDDIMHDTSYLNSIQEFKNNIRGNLVFLDWSGSRKSITGDLINSLDAIRMRINDFVPEILIFDWIGASLAKGMESRDVRHLYNDVATHLKHIAVSADLCVVSFAQLNKVLAKNKRKCDHTMLHECKSLPDQCVNAAYISALKNDDQESQDVYFRKQYMNIDKSRFGPQGLVEVRRNFEYQRFEALTSGTMGANQI